MSLFTYVYKHLTYSTECGKINTRVTFLNITTPTHLTYYLHYDILKAQRKRLRMR